MVAVYPTFEVTYHTYYLRGLVALYGRRLHYTVRGFPALHRLCFAFIADGVRVYVDARDPIDYDPVALEWCDVYGKLNLDWDTVPAERRGRFLPIGPSFSIRYWSPPVAALNAVRNYLAGRSRVKLKDTRRFFAGYWQQYKAHTWYEEYAPAPAEDGYIFFSSTLWSDQPRCNQYRVNFVMACKSLPWLQFEGGLAPRRAGLEVPPEWQPALGGGLYPIDDYRRRVARSALVFNTPAVHDCHGWKLGEYLALGKAIVTTPPLRALPAPLVHGEHAHIVDGSVESLREAVTLLCEDRAYRQRLEHGARVYFDRYLAPRRVVERLLSAGRASVTPPADEAPSALRGTTHL